MTKTASKPAVDPDLADAILRLLAERLSGFGYERADITAGRDHDGDPIITIDARYRLSPVPIDPDVTYELLTALVDLVHAHGDERFPHIRHHYHEKQKVKGFT